MPGIATLLARVARVHRRINRLCNRVRFQLSTTAELQGLHLQKGNIFHVPVRCDGRGYLDIAEDNCFGSRLAPKLGTGEILLQPRFVDSQILIGRGNSLSSNVSMIAAEKIQIGNFCLIGDQTVIIDTDFHELNPHRRREGLGKVSPVILGDNVWLGSRTMVLSGVSIGDNTVVGCMSLVTKSLPANCIAAGVPAKVIRYFE